MLKSSLASKLMLLLFICSCPLFTAQYSNTEYLYSFDNANIYNAKKSAPVDIFYSTSSNATIQSLSANTNTFTLFIHPGVDISTYTNSEKNFLFIKMINDNSSPISVSVALGNDLSFSPFSAAQNILAPTNTLYYDMTNFNVNSFDHEHKTNINRLSIRILSTDAYSNLVVAAGIAQVLKAQASSGKEEYSFNESVVLRLKPEPGRTPNNVQALMPSMLSDKDSIELTNNGALYECSFTAPVLAETQTFNIPIIHSYSNGTGKTNYANFSLYGAGVEILNAEANTNNGLITINFSPIPTNALYSNVRYELCRFVSETNAPVPISAKHFIVFDAYHFCENETGGTLSKSFVSNEYGHALKLHPQSDDLSISLMRRFAFSSKPGELYLKLKADPVSDIYLRAVISNESSAVSTKVYCLTDDNLISGLPQEFRVPMSSLLANGEDENSLSNSSFHSLEIFVSNSSSSFSVYDAAFAYSFPKTTNGSLAYSFGDPTYSAALYSTEAARYCIVPIINGRRVNSPFNAVSLSPAISNERHFTIMPLDGAAITEFQSQGGFSFFRHPKRSAEALLYPEYSNSSSVVSGGSSVRFEFAVEEGGSFTLRPILNGLSNSKALNSFDTLEFYAAGFYEEPSSSSAVSGGNSVSLLPEQSYYLSAKVLPLSGGSGLNRTRFPLDSFYSGYRMKTPELSFTLSPGSSGIFALDEVKLVRSFNGGDMPFSGIPQVISYSPQDGEQGVSLTPIFTIETSPPVDLSTLSFEISGSSFNLSFPDDFENDPQSFVSTSGLSIPLAELIENDSSSLNFEAGEGYSITLNSSTKDLYGNSFPSFSVNFVTIDESLLIDSSLDSKLMKPGFSDTVKLQLTLSKRESSLRVYLIDEHGRIKSVYIDDSDSLEREIEIHPYATDSAGTMLEELEAGYYVIKIVVDGKEEYYKGLAVLE